MATDTPLPKYPFRSDGALLVDGTLAVVDCRGSHLCGYCAFPDADIPADWRGNYDAAGLQFLEVHGGLTYAESKAGWSVFGFDCAHSGDSENDDLRDVAHVMGLTVQMRDQMLAFLARHDEFVAADRERKTVILDEVRALAATKTQMGLGGMLEMLTGAPSLGEAA